MSAAGQGHSLLGVRSNRGAAHPANSENLASGANGTNAAGQPSQRGCLGPSARLNPTGAGSGTSVSSGGMVSAVAGVASMPLAGVLGDITNMVHASRALGKVPKAFSFLHPQPQPTLGAVPLPAQAPAQVPAPPPGPAPALSAANAALVRVAPPQVSVRDEPTSAVFDGDSQDPQRASEYAADIFARLLDTESLFLPKPDYMEEQTDINGKMRAILIDWLVEVHMKYRLRPETLFLTVNIIDRYLSVRPVMRKKLQLLGVVAMFIAAKYEEIDPPKVHEFAYITDHTYSKKEIVSMECSVLVALNYQIAVPTPAHLMDRLQRANGCDAVHRSLAQYALELSLLDLRNLRHPPSLLVSAALLMSNEFLGRRTLWPASMAHHTRRSESSLRTCAADLRVVLETAKTASLQAVRRKYQLDLNHAVANLSPCRPRE